MILNLKSSPLLKARESFFIAYKEFDFSAADSRFFILLFSGLQSAFTVLYTAFLIIAAITVMSSS